MRGRDAGAGDPAGYGGFPVNPNEGGTVKDAPSQIAAAKLLRYRLTGVIVTPAAPVSLRVRAREV